MDLYVQSYSTLNKVLLCLRVGYLRANGHVLPPGVFPVTIRANLPMGSYYRILLKPVVSIPLEAKEHYAQERVIFQALQSARADLIPIRKVVQPNGPVRLSWINATIETATWRDSEASLELCFPA